MEEDADNKSLIAAIVCSSLVVVIALIIIGIGICYYRRYKKCPLPCHNCTTNCPLFKLIKCFCKGGFCPDFLLISFNHNFKQTIVMDGNRSFVVHLLFYSPMPSYVQVLLQVLLHAKLHLYATCINNCRLPGGKKRRKPRE